MWWSCPCVTAGLRWTTKTPEQVFQPNARTDGRGQTFDLAIARRLVQLHGGILSQPSSPRLAQHVSDLPSACWFKHGRWHSESGMPEKAMRRPRDLKGCVLDLSTSAVGLETRIGCSRCSVYRAQDLSFFATPLDQWNTRSPGKQDWMPEGKSPHRRPRKAGGLGPRARPFPRWIWSLAVCRRNRGVGPAVDATGYSHHPARLPGQTGLTLLDWVHRNRPQTDVVVITTQSSSRLREWCLSRGAPMFLERPIDIELLLQSLSQWRSLSEPPKHSPDASRRLLQVINESIASGHGGEIVVRSGGQVGRVFLVGQSVG